MKHSPGQWLARNTSVYTEHGACLASSILGRGHLESQQWKEESIANTHLMAAASKMLEALKTAQLALMDPDITESDRTEALIEIKAAIAKAEGRDE